MLIVKIKFLQKTSLEGITLFPFIFLRPNVMQDDSRELINHERIHLSQQRELLVVFFYLWYFIEFLYYYLLTFQLKKAYRNICFEREAYANQSNLNYLNTRKFWNFLKFRV